jgi:hypothetical protein
MVKTRKKYNFLRGDSVKIVKFWCPFVQDTVMNVKDVWESSIITASGLAGVLEN